MAAASAIQAGLDDDESYFIHTMVHKPELVLPPLPPSDETMEDVPPPAQTRVYAHARVGELRDSDECTIIAAFMVRAAPHTGSSFPFFLT